MEPPTEITKVVKSHLLVEEQVLGVPNGSFESRYFVSFKFSGLKWFLEKPGNVANHHVLHTLQKGTGWVFGGTVLPRAVEIENRVLFNGKYVYPFTVTVQSGEFETAFRFASAKKDLRKMWVTEIDRTIQHAAFVSSFADLNCFPHKLVWSFLSIDENKKLSVKDVSLPERVLAACGKYYEKQFPHGSMLETIELRSVQLCDAHISLMPPLLHMSRYIASLCLAENFLTSKGVLTLCDSLKACQHLTELDLSSNYIEDYSLEVLAKTMMQLPQLQRLNLSRNKLTERCMRPLTLYMATHRSRLEFVDFSYNLLGDSVVSFIVLLLYNKPSHLKSFDISFCAVTSRGVAELSAAIPHCSSLKYVGLKGCFPSAESLSNLVDSIGKHQQGITQQQKKQLILRENSGVGTGSTAHGSGGRGGGGPVTDLVLQIGGILQQCDSAIYMSPGTVRSALASVSDRTALHEVVLRRRAFQEVVQQRQLGSAATAVALSSSLRIASFVPSPGEHHGDGSSREAAPPDPFLLMKVHFPDHVEGPEHFLSALAVYLGADPAQFRLLLCSAAEEEQKVKETTDHNTPSPVSISSRARACFLAFVVRDVKKRRLREWHSLHMTAHHRQRQLDYSRRAAAGTVGTSPPNLNTTAPAAASQPIFRPTMTACEVFTALEEMVKRRMYVSGGSGVDPWLKQYGVQAVFLQQVNNAAANPNIQSESAQQQQQEEEARRRQSSINGGAVRHLSNASTLLQMKESSKRTEVHLGVDIPAATLRRDSTDSAVSSLMADSAPSDPLQLHFASFTPALAPADFVESVTQSQQVFSNARRGVSRPQDEENFLSVVNEEEEEEDKDDESFDEELPLLNGEEEEGDGIVMDDELFGGVMDGMDRLSLRADRVPLPLISYPPSEAAISTEVGDASTDVDAINQRNEEERHAALVRKKELRLTNERLILAVRVLFRIGEISAADAQFWEGVCGNLRYKDAARIGLGTALCTEQPNVFWGVWRRQRLCAAMIERNLQDMSSIISEFRTKRSGAEGAGSEKTQGGSAMLLARRLSAEVTGLQRSFKDMKMIATNYDGLSVVEEFLLACARLAYTGPELYEAVALRQELVEAGSETDPQTVVIDLPLIQQRALLSNLMVSRDLESLANRVDELRYATDDRFQHLPETVEAKRILTEADMLHKQLDTAVEDGDVDAIEEALAQLSYSYLYSDSVPKAISVLNARSANPVLLITPIIEGLRENNMTKIEGAFQTVRRMGWDSSFMDTVICSKIFAIKAKMVQDEDIKSKLIQFALAIKNGFDVPAGEMVQLLRRGHAINLDKDKALKPYLHTISKHVKRFSGLVRQESVLQRLIDSKDLQGLQKFLSGRGNGKLVMSAPSAFVRQEWKAVLEDCCSGNYAASVTDPETGKVNEREVFFTGTLEKAARSEDGAAKIRGWRKRFFVLNTSTMSYFTSARAGNRGKKGTIRVLGGRVRMMDISETGGRRFCLELEEGQDITLVNPDLLQEARRFVRFAQIGDIEKNLRIGVARRDLSLLTQMTNMATEMEVMVDFDVMTAAQTTMTELKRQNLLSDLYMVSKILPAGVADALVRTAESFNMDPAIPSYKLVRALRERPETDQHLLRMRGALEINDDALFRRGVKAITRIPPSQLNGKQKFMLVALLFRYVGAQGLHYVIEGRPAIVSLCPSLKHVMRCTAALLVETEVMDLVRLIISLCDELRVASPSGRREITDTTAALLEATGGQSFSGTVQGGVSGVDHFWQAEKLAEEKFAFFEATKYSKLRASTARDKGVLWGIAATFQTQQQRQQAEKEAARAAAALQYTKNGLQKSLLFDIESVRSAQEEKAQTALCIDAFTMLQVVMTDKGMTYLPKPHKAGSMRRKPATTDIEGVILELLSAAVERFPFIKDELYFHLVKQLTGNPSSSSVARGWILFSIYLHAFHPSEEAFPYIQNFVARNFEDYEVAFMLASIEANVEVSQASSGGCSRAPLAHIEEDLMSQALSDDELTLEEQALKKKDAVVRLKELKYMKNITRYCKKLCDLNEANLLQVTPLHRISRNLIAALLDHSLFQVEVGLMTGTLFKFDVAYGQFDTAHSLLSLVYDKLFPSDAAAVLHGDFDVDLDLEADEKLMMLREETSAAAAGTGTGTVLNSGERKKNTTVAGARLLEKLRQQRILRTFLGFSLFRVDEHDFADEEMLDLDLDRIAVQAVQQKAVRWSADLMWDIALTNFPVDPDASNNHSTGSNNGMNSSFECCNALILRRHFVPKQEPTLNSFAMFGSEVSVRDVDGLCQLWTAWLADREAPLPRDFARVDITFAEDSRCVNSGLFWVPDACKLYLVGMQCALAWVEHAADQWGDPEEEIMVNLHMSTRPVHKFTQLVRRRVVADVEVEPTPTEKRAAKLAAAAAKKAAVAAAAAESSSDDDDDDGAAVQISDSEDDRASAVSSEYVSSSDEDAENEKAQEARREALRKRPIQSYRSLHVELRQELRSIIERLGIVLSAPEKGEQDGPPGDDSVDNNSDFFDDDLPPPPPEEEEDEEDGPVGAADGTISETNDQLNGTNLTLANIVHWIAKFHKVATDSDVPLSSPRYRYLIKKAYSQYVAAVSPLYGHQMVAATLLPSSAEEETVDPQQQQKNKKKKKKSSTSEYDDDDDDEAPPPQHYRESDYAQEVVVSISSEGFLLLDPSDWSVLFQSPLWDIVSCRKEVMKGKKEKKSKKNKKSEAAGNKNDFAGKDILSVNVNGMILQFAAGNTATLNEIQELILQSLIVQLGTGDLPGCDLAPMGGTAAAASASIASHSMSATGDFKDKYKQFMQSYPSLPRAPVPQQRFKQTFDADHPAAAANYPKCKWGAWSALYFEAPKSRREGIAQERAEEELVEQELAKLAADAQAEKAQLQLKEGRDQMKAYQKEEGDEDEHEYGAASKEGGGGGGGDGGASAAGGGSGKSKRRKNRSVFNKTSVEDIRLQLELDRLMGVSCGVCVVSRHDSVKARFGAAPVVPPKVGGFARAPDMINNSSSNEQRRKAASASKPIIARTVRNEYVDGVPMAATHAHQAMHVSSSPNYQQHMVPQSNLSWIVDNNNSSSATAVNSAMKKSVAASGADPKNALYKKDVLSSALFASTLHLNNYAHSASKQEAHVASTSGKSLPKLNAGLAVFDNSMDRREKKRLATDVEQVYLHGVNFFAKPVKRKEAAHPEL